MEERPNRYLVSKVDLSEICMHISDGISCSTDVNPLLREHLRATWSYAAVNSQGRIPSLTPSQFSICTTSVRQAFARISNAVFGVLLKAGSGLAVHNNSGSGALRRAAAAGIDTLHVSSVTHPRSDALDAAICDALRRARADVIFLAGYMKRLGLLTLAAFPKRILNTHPALLPKFGAEGMFGDRVFEAVLAAGEPESGSSVHLVDAEYDVGAVVRQECVRVLPGDTVESLRARVQACEREAVVKTLAAIASGELPSDSADRTIAR